MTTPTLDNNDSLRALLASLLLHTPPTLDPPQLSPDLLMRHRMLGLPSTAPLAYDLDASPFSSHDDAVESQHAFVSWLSRPPVELSMAAAATDVSVTARCLFSAREKVMAVAALGEEDPIDMQRYEVWCCDAWHQDRQRRRLVRFPEVDEGMQASARLWMMVVVDPDGFKLDNLFTMDGNKDEEVVRRLHRCTQRCDTGQMLRRSGQAQEEIEQEGGAEYINDADDFWAGFSDEEQDHVPNANADPKCQGMQMTGGAADDARQPAATPVAAAQDAAIKDIIRGAYTLHRSTRAQQASEAEAIDDFVRLVRDAISHSASSAS